MICILMYLAVADRKWNTGFQPIIHFDQYSVSGTKYQLEAKFILQTQDILKVSLSTMWILAEFRQHDMP